MLNNEPGLPTNPAVAHDPGGKSKLPMLPGVRGAAEFSECGRYRRWLVRDWGFRQFSDGREPFALWIGMNPSTAGADVDDPTIRREMGFTERAGLFCYVKVNVMDYRSTSPKGLCAPGVAPCSDTNRETIRGLAERASAIIVCFGKLHKSLRRYGDAVLADLKGKDLWCLGTNGDGSPKHPLYLGGDTSLLLFRSKAVPPTGPVNPGSVPNTDDPDNNVAATPAGKGETG